MYVGHAILGITRKMRRRGQSSVHKLVLILRVVEDHTEDYFWRYPNY